MGFSPSLGLALFLTLNLSSVVSLRTYLHLTLTLGLGRLAQWEEHRLGGGQS